MPDRLLWTRHELADSRILKCGLTKITALIRSGDLPSIKLGGQRLVRDEDLRAFIASLPVEAP